MWHGNYCYDSLHLKFKVKLRLHGGKHQRDPSLEGRAEVGGKGTMIDGLVAQSGQSVKLGTATRSIRDGNIFLLQFQLTHRKTFEEKQQQL